MLTVLSLYLRELARRARLAALGLGLASAVACAALVVGCASAPLQKAKAASVDLAAVLFAVQDVETNLCAPDASNVCHSLVPAWTTEKHKAFNKELAIALDAGRALNEAVRTIPISADAKADFATVSKEVGVLTDLIVDVLPPDSPLAVKLTLVKDNILILLPLFLK